MNNELVPKYLALLQGPGLALFVVSIWNIFTEASSREGGGGVYFGHFHTGTSSLVVY